MFWTKNVIEMFSKEAKKTNAIKKNFFYYYHLHQYIITINIIIFWFHFKVHIST